MKNRIIAMTIDYVIILLICQISLIIYASLKEFNVFEATNSIIATVMILTIFKDVVFKNASIGKKIMKIEIRKEDDKIPPISTVILRNLTVIIWPLECLLIVMRKKRIGDIICGTKVAEKKLQL